jgi:PAS domain S-box-containing protein
MRALIQFLRRKLIQVAMLLLAFLLIASCLITWYNKKQLVSTAQIKKEGEMVKYLLEGIFERTLRQVDLSLRGYALTNNTQMLGPMNNALREYPINLKKIDSLLKIQKLDTSIAVFNKVKFELNNYVDVTKTMLKELENGNKEEFLRLMTQDKGYDAWRAFAPFFGKTVAYENKLIEKAQADYEAAMNGNVIFQLVLVITGSAILLLITARLRKESRIRAEVFSTLDQSARQYLFNPGNSSGNTQQQASIITDVITHFKKASAFISSITQGNYQVNWEGLDSTNEKLNQETLAGQLHRMKDKLIAIRQEDEKRNWLNQGLTNYSELVRKFQHNLDDLCFESVKFLVKYINAQQGGLFIVAEEGGEKHLALKASYAFERKKYLEKKIDIGNGLVGQTYLEGEVVKMTQLPDEYTHITSGLGEARANCLVILPLKHNEETVAILEIASLYDISAEHIKFMERCGEFLSSALSNAQTNSQIRKLLQDTQMQAESMRSQEEEMRQNMEELTATQEEMQRQGNESKGMLETLIGILNELPQKIFLKDEDGKMVLANVNVAKAHDMSVEQLIGKSDFDFVDAKTAQEWRNQELEIIRKGKEIYTFDETLHGQTKTLTTVKMAFYIPHLKQTGLLGIQTDVTELKKLRKMAESN